MVQSGKGEAGQREEKQNDDVWVVRSGILRLKGTFIAVIIVAYLIPNNASIRLAETWNIELFYFAGNFTISLLTNPPLFYIKFTRPHNSLHSWWCLSSINDLESVYHFERPHRHHYLPNYQKICCRRTAIAGAEVVNFPKDFGYLESV